MFVQANIFYVYLRTLDDRHSFLSTERLNEMIYQGFSRSEWLSTSTTLPVLKILVLSQIASFLLILLRFLLKT